MLQKDIIFEGFIGVLVSALFLYVSYIEIPFYPQETTVQLVAVVALVGSLLAITVGYLVGRK